jgi:hypothetical protein
MSGSTSDGLQADDLTKLTAYETEQVRQIAAWKSKPPNPLSELVKKITLAGADYVEKVIPDDLVRVAIEKAYKASELLDAREAIQRLAGIKDLRELWHKPLEECDRLACRVHVESQTLATVEGAATGAGGVFTTLIDLPLLFVLSLRTILKIGHCYGYPLEHGKDQRFVLGVLIAATSGSLEIKRKRLDQLRELEHLLIEETQEEILAEEALSLLFQLEIFEDIPGVGAISGAWLNLSFMRRVDHTAQRVFQERWLRHNGKVHTIMPAPIHERHLVGGWSGALGRAVYSGCYGLGFGVTLPAWMVASLVPLMANALTDGVRGGAATGEALEVATLSPASG